MTVALVFAVDRGAPVWAAGGRPSGQMLDLASIRSEQQAVVTANHQGAIDVAQFAVDELTATVASDQQALSSAEDAAGSAQASQQAAAGRLAGDRSALAAAAAGLAAATARLARDRAELRSIAIGMYTGELTNPQPTSLRALEADQKQAIYSAEVETVAGVVDAHVGRDLNLTRAAAANRAKTASSVAADQRALGTATSRVGALSTQVAAARSVLTADTAHLNTAEQGLAVANASLAAALADVAGPAGGPGGGGMSVIGGAALTADQLVAWYRSQGYVDLTSTPITQLAKWYLSSGQDEGVRGDVAFAQAVLETGGFSSPDSVTFNNYAGIGHCDSCVAGWAFPTARAGVLGQVQLLRIFADGSPPAGSPAPVLPALAPGGQSRRDCCHTWESLTGVWATDPTYGTQILGIYQQMLASALRGRHS